MDTARLSHTESEFDDLKRRVHRGLSQYALIGAVCHFLFVDSKH